MAKYYLYRHIRLDTGEPFYIGKGTKRKYFSSIQTEFSRAYSKHRRSNFWKNITNKIDYKVEILFESNNHNLIVQKEKEFIKLYGRKDLDEGTLCNLTDKHGGLPGFSHSDKAKREIGIKNSKENNGMWGREGPRKGVKVSKSTKEKMRKAALNRETPNRTKKCKHIPTGKVFSSCKKASKWNDTNYKVFMDRIYNDSKLNEFKIL